ncbi:MAG: hypothetical protein K8I27_17070 [Planctomycetes bacterium]|nr:hypothetical protein [Planctomycetota bacterium]
MWVAFAAVGTTLLLAYTNQVCLDVASVPFLWVTPLSLYLSHLKPGGVICVHISNRHLNLRPVVIVNAKHISLSRLGWFSGTHFRTATTLAEWVIMTTSGEVRESFEKYLRDYAAEIQDADVLHEFQPIFGEVVQLAATDADFRPWTDDYSNHFEIIRD